MLMHRRPVYAAAMLSMAGLCLALVAVMYTLGIDMIHHIHIEPTPVQQLQPSDFHIEAQLLSNGVSLQHLRRDAPPPADCGDTCRHDITGTPSLFFDFIRKEVNCRAMWENATVDIPMADPNPPSAIPEHLMDAYTYGGRVPVRPWSSILNQRYLGGDASTNEWHASVVDEWARKCNEGTLEGNYGVSETRYLREGLQRAAPLGKVLVIGSENPWVEACALGAGATHVTTLEYGRITSHHPNISTVTPDQARARFDTMSEEFDTIATYSSVEHAGLGRYGDALNPWGDRQTIARAWCAAKPGAHLIIGVPTEGSDSIMYNAHRIYGPVMYPHLVANWEQLWRAPGIGQIVHVLRKSV